MVRWQARLRTGAFTSRRGPGEGSVAGRGRIRRARPKLLTSVLSFRASSRGISLWLFVPPAPSLPRLELQRKRCPKNQVASHPRKECLQRRQPSLFRPPPSAIGPAQGEIPRCARNDMGFSIRPSRASRYARTDVRDHQGTSSLQLLCRAPCGHMDTGGLSEKE